MQTQRDFFSTREKRLIAFHSRISPQMLILERIGRTMGDSRWLASNKEEVGGEEEEVEVCVGWGGEILTNSESSVHIISRPWQAFPCMNSKLVKPTAGFISIWHPSCRSVLCFHCTVSTIRRFGNRPMTSVKAPPEKLGPIWHVSSWLWAVFVRVQVVTQAGHYGTVSENSTIKLVCVELIFSFKHLAGFFVLLTWHPTWNVS